MLKDTQDIIEHKLKNIWGNDFKISAIHGLSGGCINEVYLIKTNEEAIVAKINSSSKYPHMLDDEARALKFLNNKSSIYIPEVFLTFSHNNKTILLMEYIEPHYNNDQYDHQLGVGLAELHKNSNESFGLKYDNWIATLRQYNKYYSSWESFYKEQRIVPQMNLAKKKLDKESVALLEKFLKATDLFPIEKPSLLHGDLWSGNIIPGNKPCIIDPSIYFGHREVDLAMTRLFGGFSNTFYDSYNLEYPLENGWENRISICTIYPALVHVNLFGATYLPMLKSSLELFK